MKYPIHPEIERFWEEAGYNLFCKITTASRSWEDELLQHGFVRWYVKKDNTQQAAASVFNLPAPITDYFYEGKIYSEQQMLRLVRLKAFM